MKLLFSVPTGYHLRELVMPLKKKLETDTAISEVVIVSPGAAHESEIFTNYSSKFTFVENPPTDNLKAHKGLLATHKPDIVITDTVGLDALDYPILKSAQELTIRTLTFIASWDNVWKIDRHVKGGHPVAFADSFIVWNQMMKEHLLRVHPAVQESAIAVIGAPRLDYFWQKDQIPSKKMLYDYLGLKDYNRPLIHFTTTELYPMDYIVQAIREGVSEGVITKNPYLYASVHPGGSMENHKSLKKYDVVMRYSFGRRDDAPIKEFAYNISEEEQYMLTSLFTHADLLVNHSSSTALESLIGKTPVINVKYGRPLDWWRWFRSPVYRDFKEHYVDIVRYDATSVVKSKKELLTATQELLSEPKIDEEARMKTIKRMITTVDGTAGGQVLERIKDRVR